MASVLSVARNDSSADLENMEELLFASTREIKNKVLVDDGSVRSEDTKKLADTYGWMCVSLPKPVGHAYSINTGMCFCTEPTVLIAGTDTYFPKGTIADLERHVKNGADAVGPQFNEKFVFTSQYNRHAPKVNKGLEEIEAYAQRMRSIFTDEEREVSITGVAYAINKDMFVELKGYDESYGLGVYDDTDFMTRAKQSGKRVVFAPGIFVSQGAVNSSSRTAFQEGSKGQETFWYGVRNMAKFAKTLGPSIPVIGAPIGLAKVLHYTVVGLLRSTGMMTISNDYRLR